MAKTAKVDNSPANQGYAFLSAKVSRKNNEANQVVQNIRTFSVTNPQMVPQLQNDLVRIQEEKSRFLDSVITAGGYLGKIASLLRFKPFDGNMLARYGNESNYFLRTFFNGIDLKDSEMAYIPQFGDRFRQFVFNLVQQQQPADSISKYVNQTFSQIDPQSSSYMVALSAVIQGLDQAQSDLFLPYAEEFLQKYPKPTSFTQNLQVRVEAIRRFAVGATPPEISLPDQNGNILTLSSLKGKYVMIDFWASWCRPCRAENPNVVRLYKQYHNKGFEVLGVSLDKEKNAWMAAIQQDGLVWKHVSDLQFWQSRAAQDYGVNSIPMTFLLDKEGKIIGKNLRGPALEEKLKELFNS
ncbi:MAG: TlpA family protein disulfide reductase [Bacteroidia bacterium]|nr:TlpA family protein disulfide reductase [Bacteroidia bacterium]